MNWKIADTISKLVASTALDAEHNGLRIDVLAETWNGTSIGIECKEWDELTPETEKKAQRQVDLLESGLVDRAFIVLPALPDERQSESVRNIRGILKSIEEIVESEPEFRFRGQLPSSKKESKKDERRIFVAMPFAAHLEDTYYLGIVPSADRASASCTRADEPRFHQHILDTIHREIGSADLVLADLTGANPNVTYEMGYAHGLKKPMIHISATPPEQLPFDFRQWPIVVYELGQVHALRKRLEELVSAQFAK